MTLIRGLRMNKRRREAVGWGVENQSETLVCDATISGVL